MEKLIHQRLYMFLETKEVYEKISLDLEISTQQTML